MSRDVSQINSLLDDTITVESVKIPNLPAKSRNEFPRHKSNIDRTTHKMSTTLYVGSSSALDDRPAANIFS